MLEEILAATRRRVAESRAIRPRDALTRLAAGAPATLSLTAALGQPGVQLIAEIKRRSPSRGDLRPDLDPAAQAAAYARGGAAALSVLTEPTYFAGALEDLALARRGLAAGRTLPILRKDFIIDPYQVLEARVCGADAILLIVAALAPEDLTTLYAEARGLGLDVLVEVHEECELERALAVEPAIVGINSRNLRDMTVDLRVVERLRPLIPAGKLVVAESGVRGPEDVRRLHDLGVDAILVGEALVRAGQPEAAVRALVEAGQ